MARANSFSFGVWYNGLNGALDAATLSNATVDWLIMDVARESIVNRSETLFTASEIQTATSNAANGGPGEAFGYLSIGKITNQRQYWIDEPGLSGDQRAFLDGDEPAWVGGRALDGSNDRLAAFWTDEWQAIMERRIDDMIDRGFSGAFFDDVATYFLWYHATGGFFDVPPLVDLSDVEIADLQNGPAAAQAMMALITELSAYAKARDPDFKIIANIDPYLVTNANLLGDPQGRDTAFFNSLDAVLTESQLGVKIDAQALDYLQSQYRDNGIDVLALEFNQALVPDGNGGLVPDPNHDNAGLSPEDFIALVTAQAATYGFNVAAQADNAFNTPPPRFNSPTDDDDVVVARAGQSTAIDGGEGNDTLTGLAGNDGLRGGQGDDFLVGGAGDDTLNGGSGFDTVSYANDISGIAVNLDTVARRGIAAQTAIDGWGNTDSLSNFQTLIGSAFDDTIIGRQGSETLIGGDGDDQIRGQGGNDILIGGIGNDFLDGQSGEDTVDYSAAASGIDVDLTAGTALDGDGGMDTLVSIERVIGSSYLDIIMGSAGNERFSGGDGADYITGGGGNDYLEGGAEVDDLFGNDGTDRLYGDDGDDYLYGGAGRDVMDGGAGRDYIEGDDGEDRMFGRDGDDEMFGGSGFDIINGQDGNDRIFGGDDRDILRGQSGNDEIYGDGGDDTLSGDTGADLLNGGAGKDLLKGGEGDDTLTGGEGDDRLIGGDGIDTAVFSGNLADYNIVFRNGVVRLTDTVGSGGFDKLTGVEFLEFADGIVDVSGL